MIANSRIAFVSNTSWSIYNFRLDVMRHIKKLGAEIYIIAPRDKHSEKLIAEGFHFIHAPVKAYSNNPLADIRYFAFLLKTYQNVKFDHIFHYTIKANIYGSVAAKFSGRTSTAVVTGLGRLLNLNDGIQKRIAEALYRVGCATAYNVWFLNQEDRMQLTSKGYLKKSKTFLLPSEGVNLEIFKPMKKIEKKKNVRFLYAGRLIKEKGILAFLGAAEKVKKFHPATEFNIVGFIDPLDGNSIDVRLIQKSQQNGTTTFYGDTEDVKPYLNRTDCVVLPSYYGEGVSRILLEASAMEIPIITTDNRGCKEVIVDGYNGFVCNMRNTDSLVDQLMAFISLDQDARTVMGQNGRKLVVSKYDVKSICTIYEQFLDQKLKSTKKKKSKLIKYDRKLSA
jgi:glycosyltransferase involved in cell wall biosynthesis